MAKTRGTGLLMVWADVDAQHEAEYNRWYDHEHLKRLLEVPGFLAAGRYEALRGGPRYLAMYELDDVHVLRTAAFLDEIRYRPSAVRSRISGGHIGRNYLIQGYRQIFPPRTEPIEATMPMPPYLQMARIDIPAAMEEEFNEWYNTTYIPGYLALPGVRGARRFVVVDGQPKYLTVYDLADPGIPDGEGWKQHQFGHPWTRRVRRHMLFDPGSPALYRRIYPPLP